ncbi:electron transfer flavoprotein-ubiquinone oxidoreductase [Cocleimonas flava]|uniref:Electron transfer flavoprotein-ubiquinone oxidoreductase n=1 Tax=Cocleimonas flava TaxID=634765 RepID=A0A4R1EZ18_9GAMM|nr:electron-transferring-flavoprotein dehydrogenase [Cocleimonas flava]
MSERDSIDVDVVIVGAGPAGLSTAIRLSQLAKEKGQELAITVLEKGAEVGAHSLAGAILETRALDELIPDWKDKGAPISTAVTEDHFTYLTEKGSKKLPTPPSMHNEGNYVISISRLTKWLGEQAEAMGIEIYAGFAAAEVLYDDNNKVVGVATGETGVDKEGNKTPSYDPGMELRAKLTIVAEGCRGSLSRVLTDHYDLAKDSSPQTYGLGIKEVWEVKPEKHTMGKTLHTIGWPLKSDTYGGSFLYHMEKNLVAVGFVVGLDYTNPYLSPFEEFQRFKSHPSIRPLFEDGQRLSYGARAIVEGGLQSLPKLDFPGGLLIGDAAGFLNVAKIKGIHTAMKSGMLAAEATFAALEKDAFDSVSYEAAFKNSWMHEELHKVRNIRPGFSKGLLLGLANAGLTAYVTRGKEPWTMTHHADHLQLKKKTDVEKIEYPAPDGKVTFDRLSSVYLSNTFHDENQPIHLKLKDQKIAIDTNLDLYDSPESRYCPAAVYEIVEEEDGSKALLINSQNCVHCKTCDIKDPTQNIVWTTPESGGPMYSNM